jgi:hypothetical protein
VIVCDGVALPLISVRYLTKVLNYKVFDSDDKAYVLKEIEDQSSSTGDTFNINYTNYRVIASATIVNNLYQVDDMTAFLDPLLEPYVHSSNGPTVA